MPKINHEVNWNRSGSPKERPEKSRGKGVSRERLRPATNVGTATTKPANGPATPMSKRIGLVLIGPRIRMNAPRVPVRKIGAGIK